MVSSRRALFKISKEKLVYIGVEILEGRSAEIGCHNRLPKGSAVL